MSQRVENTSIRFIAVHDPDYEFPYRVVDVATWRFLGGDMRKDQCIRATKERNQYRDDNHLAYYSEPMKEYIATLERIFP